MRILMAGQTWGPRNGPGVFTARLAKGLVAAGHRVLVAVPAEALRSARAVEDGVELAFVRALPLVPAFPEVHMSVAARRPMRRLIEAFRPDAVHLHDHYPLSAATLAEAKERAPIVASNHFLPENAVPRLEGLLWRWVRRVLGQADRLTAANPTAAAILTRHCPGIPVDTVSYGVDLDRFRPASAAARDSARRRWGLSSSATVCAYVGRLDPEKRVDVLLEAAARLAHPQLQLVVVGRGREEEALHRLAARLRLGGRAVFTGFVPDPDLPSLLASADFFAMPSAAELQSIATLEAMACGLPAVAANARALPELVVPGETGQLFRPGDAADAARALAGLMEPGLRERLGQTCLARVQAHAVRRTVERYVEIYERSLATSSARLAAHRSTR